MTSQFSLLFSGIVLGLSSGLSPGPMTALIISETLRHSIKEGVKISFVPLLTDLPIVCIAIFILSRLSDMFLLMGVISILGGAFLVYLGYESISVKGIDIHAESMKPRSVRKGVIVNLLNPNPYLFWFTIGSPLVLKAFRISWFYAFLFIFCFYTFLVGSKALIAIIVGKSSFLLKGNNYIYTIRFLGIILFVFAVIFIKDGLAFFWQQ